MRPALYVLSFLAVIALGFWAYRENYKTQGALREVASLQDEIAQLHEALSVQRAEWAYLNRPDRLRDLVTINFDRLGLMPMEPWQFGSARDVAYPLPPSIADRLDDLDLSSPVDISGSLNADPEEQSP